MRRLYLRFLTLCAPNRARVNKDERLGYGGNSRGPPSEAGMVGIGVGTGGATSW